MLPAKNEHSVLKHGNQQNDIVLRAISCLVASVLASYTKGREFNYMLKTISLSESVKIQLSVEALLLAVFILYYYTTVNVVCY